MRGQAAARALDPAGRHSSSALRPWLSVGGLCLAFLALAALGDAGRAALRFDRAALAARREPAGG